jgi:hypothetical protein
MCSPGQWPIGVAALIELRDPAGKLIATLNPSRVPNGTFLGEVARTPLPARACAFRG